MRWMARGARSMSQRGRVLIVLAACVAYGAAVLLPANAALLIPAKVNAAAIAHSSGGRAPRQLPAISRAGQASGGTAAVGALFTVSGGKPGTHFCTASVVQSTHGDLAVTAAHCMTGVQGQVVFVPGYANGKEPYGAWPVTAVYTDQAWKSAKDPDDDVAFLRLSDASGGPVEDITGAERLATDWQLPALVQVIGYPDGADQPTACTNWAKAFSPTQLEFDCDGYTDGTSGGPFLADSSAASGQGTVIGVIGGYEQGGNTPQVSYAATFGTAVTALYHSAEAAS